MGVMLTASGKISIHHGVLMKSKTFIMALVLVLLFTSACQAGPDPAAIQATSAAGIAAALKETAAAASPTPLPPTSTLEPTATRTPKPSPTPTITPTPGPFSYSDDFSSMNTTAWSQCDKCSWKDDQLILGPYDPGKNAGENLNFVLCTACGKHKYYRMSVDATFLDGQVDRYFGILAPISADHVYYMGISPYQFAIVRDYDYSANLAKNLKTSGSGLVKAGAATNHFEIEVKPAKNSNLVDIYYSLNGKTYYVLTGRKAEESMVGLGMSFHSVTVAYDNFEYIVLEPGQ
jgi:hypothetical protein